MNNSNSQKENILKINNEKGENEDCFETINHNEGEEDTLSNKPNYNKSSDKSNIKISLKNKKNSYEYKIGNYLIQKTIGQGTFGKVKLGLYIPLNEKVAVKILEKRKLLEKDDEIRVKREFDMLSKFNHPNVIMVTEIFESSNSFYSVMEFCSGGELFNYIVSKKRLSENETSFFYYQIINGLEYIHSLGIVHRDLKPENLLLTNEHLLKIIDFGLSNYFSEDKNELLMTPCGSPCYASPEMVAGKKYNGFKIDIWATGIILFAMLCGYLPFEDKDNDILFKKILDCNIDFPEYLSDTAKDLIRKILVVNPEERISIDNIKKHKFYLTGKKFFNEIFTVEKVLIENPKENKNRTEKYEQDELNNFTVDTKSDEKRKLIDFNNYIQESNLENKENINQENIIKNNNTKTDDNKNSKTTQDNNIKIDNNENKKEKKNIKNDEKENKKENKYFNYITSINGKKIINNIKNTKNKNKKTKKTKYDPKTKTVSKNSKNKQKKDIKESKNKKIKETVDKKQNNALIDGLNKERNTVGTIGSIGSSALDNFNNNSITQQTNITNLMVNNINYNVNISLDHTKRTYSNDNQSMQNNTINNNNNNNKIFKNTEQNNINIIEKNNTKENNSKIHNYLNNNNKYKEKNNKINKKKNRPNKIKKNVKNFINSNNIKSERDEGSFNIYKYLINNSTMKKLHTESLFKKLMGKKNNNTFRLKSNISNLIENINRLKIIKTNGSSLPKSSSKSKSRSKSKNKNKTIHNNNFSNYKNIINKLEGKSINKDKYNQKRNNTSNNNKSININLNNISNKGNQSLISNNFLQNKNLNISNVKNPKRKSKELFKKSSKSLINKNDIINLNKKNNKFQYNSNLSHHSMDIEINPIIMQTDPNMNFINKSICNNSKVKIKINSGPKKKKFISEINSNSNMMINKKLNYGKKYNFNSFRQPLYYKQLKANLASPIKQDKKIFLNNNLNQNKKKQLIKIRNSENNYESSLSNPKSQKIFSQRKKYFTNYNNDSTLNRYLEKKSKSIESKEDLSYKNEKRKNDYYKKVNKSFKSNNFMTNNNISNIRIINKTPIHISNISQTLLKNKYYENKENKKLKNKILKDNKNNNNSDLEKNTIKKYNNKNMNKINQTESILKIKENNNKQILLKSVTYQNTSLSLLNTNKKHLKFNSMKITNIYKNNIRKKNKIKIVNLIKKINNKSALYDIGNLSINKKGTISNPSLFPKQVIFITNYNTKKFKKNIKKPLNENKNKSQINHVKNLHITKNNTIQK